MKGKRFNYLILWTLFITFAVCGLNMIVIAEPVQDGDFVNPLDILNFDPVNMRMNKDPYKDPGSKATVDVTSGTNKDSHQTQCVVPVDDFCEKTKLTHETAVKMMRQYAMKLVHLTESKVDPSIGITRLDLRVHITSHGLLQLQRFGQGADSNVHDLFETLSLLLQFARPAPVEDGKAKVFMYWLEDRLGLSMQMMILITVQLVAALLIVNTVSHLRVSRQLIRQSLYIIVVISIIMTMVEMYQGKTAEQEEMLMQDIREHCPRLKDMSIWSRIWSTATSPFTFESDSCKKYMKAMMVSPLLSASPLEAFARVVVKTLVGPLDLVGQGIKNFIVALLKDIPVQYQIFVIICLCVLVVLLPLLAAGYHLNIAHIINIGPGQRARAEIQYVPRDPNLPSISASEQQSHALRARMENPVQHASNHQQISSWGTEAALRLRPNAGDLTVSAPKSTSLLKRDITQDASVSSSQGFHGKPQACQSSLMVDSLAGGDARGAGRSDVDGVPIKSVDETSGGSYRGSGESYSSQGLCEKLSRVNISISSTVSGEAGCDAKIGGDKVSDTGSTSEVQGREECIQDKDERHAMFVGEKLKKLRLDDGKESAAALEDCPNEGNIPVATLVQVQGDPSNNSYSRDEGQEIGGETDSPVLVHSTTGDSCSSELKEEFGEVIDSPTEVNSTSNPSSHVFKPGKSGSCEGALTS